MQEQFEVVGRKDVEDWRHGHDNVNGVDIAIAGIESAQTQHQLTISEHPPRDFLQES